MCGPGSSHRYGEDTQHRPPSAGHVSVPARVGMAVIRAYQLSLSAFMGRGCRYAPSCSWYTSDAMARYGFWAGGWIGLARILRCRPGGGSGFDPIPGSLPDNARWYLPWRYGHWTSDHIDPATRLD